MHNIRRVTINLILFEMTLKCYLVKVHKFSSILYLYYIVLKCYHINTIFMHNVDFKSDHKPYSIFEIYLVKYTNLVQSYTWPHFQFICLI